MSYLVSLVLVALVLVVLVPCTGQFFNVAFLELGNSDRSEMPFIANPCNTEASQDGVRRIS